jgi:ABC-type Na+ efflux pump permease subunit
MNTDSVAVGKGRRIAGIVLICLGSLVLIASAGAKLAHVPKVVNELGAFGFDGARLTFIAITEIVSALLFLVPLSRSAGLLLISAYLGGAIATHVQHGQSFLQPAMILSLLWLGAWLRNPEVLWSLNQSPAASR